MKKTLVLFVFIVFLCPSTVFAKKIPVKIDNLYENDFIINEMLPNPNVYLYGVDSNGFPILLMNFSSTIPFYTITDETKFIKKILPFWRKKISSLKFFNIYLKLEPSDTSKKGKNFYYRILKLECREVSQGIAYQDENTITARAEANYAEMAKGYIQDEFKRTTNYTSRLPIITYSGIGSDTLKIMLKKGRKYPIPAGHIDVSMLVMAVPYYDPPITYDSLKQNKCTCKYNFLKDFMDFVETKKTACVEKDVHVIRKIFFKKIYFDNRNNSYYEVGRFNNPNKIYIDSEVIMSNRINQIPIITTGVSTNINLTNPRCPINCNILFRTKSSSEKPTEVNPVNQKVQDVKQHYKLKSPFLEDSNFMYNRIFAEQTLNPETFTTPFKP